MEDEAKTRSRSTLSTIVTLAVCIWAVYLAVDLMQEPFQVEPAQQNKDTPVQYKHLPWGKPPVLMSYGEFCKRSLRANQTNVEHSHRSIMFNFFVLVIGRQNFATVAGLSSFYMHQHLLYADLTLDEQNNLDTVPFPSSSNITYIDERGQPDEMIAAPATFKEALKDAFDFKMPAGIEVDQTGCLEEVRDQKSCGACYAFAIYALLEWHYCKQSGGTKVDFSEQHMVDCGHEWQLNGCNGGMFTNAKRFINNYGVKFEKDYPYKGERNKLTKILGFGQTIDCKHVHKGAFKTKLRTEKGFNEWVRIERSRTNLENAVKEQPVAVELHMPVYSQLGLRGIDDGKWCTETRPHGMLLVGYGTEKGVPYWLLRNSHGRMANSNGYFRLKRDLSDPAMMSCIRSAFIASPYFEPLGEEAQRTLYESFEFNVEEAPKKILTGGVMKNVAVHSAKK